MKIDLKEMQKRREISPEEPWRWNPNEDSRQIEFRYAGIRLLWPLAIFWR
jgi:hypothetical protein